MSWKGQLGFIFLVQWIIHSGVTVSSSSRPDDILQSFTDTDGNEMSNVVVDPSSGDVYVAGLNVLYHLSPDFEVKQKVATGPLEDAHNCPMPPYDCDTERELKDNKNILLKMVDFLGSPPKLLLCGSVYRKLCQVRPIDNLDEVHWVHPHNGSLGYYEGLETDQAIFYRGHRGQWMLAIARNPFLYRKVLVKEGDDYHFRYPLQDDPSSGRFQLYKTVKEHDRSFVFVHDGSFYFVTSFRMYGNTHVKLLRFCSEDPSFQSYGEFHLDCSLIDEDGLLIAGGINFYLAHYGDSPASTGKSLYVSLHDMYRRSTMCIYPMTAIVDSFNRAPATMDQETFSDICKRKKDDDRTIGRSIGIPNIVTQHKVMETRRFLLFLTTVKQNDSVVLVGLTMSGSIFKVSLSTGVVISFTDTVDQKMFSYFLTHYVFDRKGEHIYYQFVGKIFRYNVASCGLHGPFSLCLKNGQKDPLGCGWCEGNCTTQEQCPHPVPFLQGNGKVPRLNGIHPRKGPTSGGTQVTMFGENLGCFTVKKCEFFVGRRACNLSRIDELSATCVTGKDISFGKDVDESIVFRIDKSTYVIDKNPPPTFNMTGLSHSFEYTPDPEILQLQPGFTTTSGLLNVTATGLHLDSVQNPKLVVKFSIPQSGEDLEFEILEDCWSDPESSGTFMTCRTPPLPQITEFFFPTSSSPLLTHVAFIMDGVQLLKDFNVHQEKMSRLWYYPDPIFEEVSNIGNETLVITGTHLYLKDLSRFQIRFGHDYFCNNMSFSEEKITCDIPSNLTSNSTFFGTDIPVEVILGYYEQEIGYIMIGQSTDDPTEVENPTNPSKMWWNFLVLIPLFVVPVAFICFKRWKKKGLHPTNKANKGENLNDKVSIANESTGSLASIVQGSSFESEGKSLTNTEANTVENRIKNQYTDKNPAISRNYLFVGVEAGAEDLPLTNEIAEIPASPDSVVRGSSSVSQGSSAERTEIQNVDSAILNLLDRMNLVIPKTWLCNGEKVGEGQFGCVFEGLLQRSDQHEKVKVAIKTLHEHSWSNPRTVESFLKEALIMKDFDHPNVLTLLGVCFEGSGPSIVLPLMENGDLCSYIRDETKVLLVSDLLHFAIDVASGMAYLGKKKFVHRDLAARNCIMDSSLAVKVADFGLSRDVYMEDYYRCEDKNARLPCRWMAPESLEKQLYNTKTDVWSYGVLLWELMTRGSVPYTHVCNWDMLEYVRLGHRLDQPEHCPKSLYMVMLACWNKDSKLRPSFPELHVVIGRLRQRILATKKKKAESKSVPAQHAVYYNSKALYLKMDGHVISKEFLEESDDLENEYMNTETSV